MPQSEAERVDAVIVGANTRGLITAYVLSQLGYRAVLIERGAAGGGVDGSFVTAEGTRFDHGLHVLDFMRSEVATRLFTHVVGGAVHRITLKRGIALRKHVVPYAPLPAELPEELRDMLPSDELVDDLEGDPPTRARLAKCYGAAFTDFVFDEVLPSYRSEHRHAAFGVPEEELLTNVYPWLFPRARRGYRAADESRAFHDKLRAGIEQQILYPREGGFGGFAAGFLSHLDKDRIEVLDHAGEVRLVCEPGTRIVRHVEAKGRRFEARHYFWATSWPKLCAELAIPCQEIATDRLLVGSFRLDRPATSAFHEILVGDPDLMINRVYFPARFRESDEPLLQIEYCFPALEEGWSLEPDHWRATWLDDLRQLGLIDEAHRVVEFDFKTFVMHYNGFGMEGERLRDADPSELVDSNVHAVVPSMANLNLNAYVPRVISQVTDVLARGA